MSWKSILSLLGVYKNRTFLVMAMRGRRVSSAGWNDQGTTARGYLSNSTADLKSISQPYRCYAKPYRGSGSIKYLARCARSARQVGQSRSENISKLPYL